MEWITFINMASKEIEFLDITNEIQTASKIWISNKQINFWNKYAPCNIWDILITKKIFAVYIEIQSELGIPYFIWQLFK